MNDITEMLDIFRNSGCLSNMKELPKQKVMLISIKSSTCRKNEGFPT